MCSIKGHSSATCHQHSVEAPPALVPVLDCVCYSRSCPDHTSHVFIVTKPFISICCCLCVPLACSKDTMHML